MTSGEAAPTVRLTDVRASLDDALVQLRAIREQELDVSAAERSLGEALRHVYSALANNNDFGAFREETAHAVEDVRHALAHLMTAPTQDAGALHVSELVAKSLGDLHQLGWVMLDTWLPRISASDLYVKATMDQPRLLELSRRVVDPGIPVDPPPAIPAAASEPPEVLEAPARSLEEVRKLALETKQMLDDFVAAQEIQAELEANPPDEEIERVALLEPVHDTQAVEELFGLPLPESELLRERATDLMDDLSMLGRMRRCTDPEPWASGEETERRMLTKVDALAACGVDAFSEVVRMLDDRPLPDPELTFGNVFFFGSLAGDDAFDQIIRLVEVSDLDDPEMLSMIIDGLWLTPTPRVDQALPRWLAHEDANRRALAIEVLRRRRTLTNADFDHVGTDPDPRVLASAARAIPTLPQPAPPGALTWFLGRPDEEVVRAALESAFRLRRVAGYHRAVDLVAEGRGAFADAILFVAIGGGVEARPIVEHEMASAGHSAALRAAGWYGEPTFVPFLLGRLRHGDESAATAALDALERITGASIVDAGITLEYRPTEEPFTGTERPPYEPPGLLDGTPDAWAAWWDAWGEGAVEGVRYRWGRRWSVESVMHELGGGAFIQRDRPWAAMELSARAGAPPHLDWTDWILRQRRALDELRRGAGHVLATQGWPTLVGGPR